MAQHNTNENQVEQIARHFASAAGDLLELLLSELTLEEINAGNNTTWQQLVSRVEESTFEAAMNEVANAVERHCRYFRSSCEMREHLRRL